MCVIDARGLYVTMVLVLIESNEDGAEQSKIQHYTLMDGESLVDTTPPTYRLYAGAMGLVNPRWDGSTWVESATADEIAVWEVAHPSPIKLIDYKTAKVTNSKTQLATYLEAHPLTYTDGKQYSVTAEKQSLLTSALARYQIATASGVQTSLKWNATGEECTVWEYADLAALALAIAAYVEPLVSQQQAAEVAINACSTVAEVEAIVIAYGS